MISNRLKVLRKSQNLNHSEFAEKLGISKDLLFEIEIGSQQVTKEIYLDLIKNLSIEEIENLSSSYELNSEMISQAIKNELNAQFQMLYDRKNDIEAWTIVLTKLRESLKMNESEFNQYVPLLSKIRNIPPDLLDMMSDPELALFHDTIRRIVSRPRRK